ncbi:chemotaxis protein CheD [Methanoregula sp.]|uniref:chemotaxis protein CheD n=1 Tax=Methanoregula sp. TaxID=2052170 RepID=UPI00236BAC5B|nr:chemotaxis protein CheD [Methanoregula sp.]MDD1687054.1 chemotaxis protein CheD [Methanoregula sp.]
MTELTSPSGQTAMIGIGEYRVGSFPMMTIGLGSCIGLTLYDDTLKVGAMVHIMLPDSAGRKDRPGKYADTAIPLLLKELNALGCKNRSLVAKMAGGACMFEYFGTNLNIGERNAEKVRAVLKENNIKLAKEEVGGKVGRSVTFLPASNGKITIRRADGTAGEL